MSNGRKESLIDSMKRLQQVNVNDEVQPTKADTPFDDNTISTVDVKPFDNPILTGDDYADKDRLEEVRALSQTRTRKWVNGLGKLVGKTAINVTGGGITLSRGIYVRR